MKLKFVIPDMKETFGNLEFAGEGRVSTKRGNNGQRQIDSRTYDLYSDVQRADNVSVTLPASAGTKDFKPDDRIVLINPRITAAGKKAGNTGYTDYILSADDMVRA